jgi:hypothetical protein
VHYETLRAVYMDLASELGEAGFRWIFLFQGHGSMSHNLALDQASDFFADTKAGSGRNTPPGARLPRVLGGVQPPTRGTR